jgi:hypothetical protein
VRHNYTPLAQTGALNGSPWSVIGWALRRIPSDR